MLFSSSELVMIMTMIVTMMMLMMMIMIMTMMMMMMVVMLAHGWRPPRGGKRAQRDNCP